MQNDLARLAGACALWLAFAAPALAQTPPAEIARLDAACTAGELAACTALGDVLREQLSRGVTPTIDAGDLLRATCNAGDRTACIRADLADRVLGNAPSDEAPRPVPAADAGGPAGEPAAPAGAGDPVAPQAAPDASAPEAAPDAAQAERSGRPIWQYILFVLGGLFLIRLGYRYAKFERENPVADPEAEAFYSAAPLDLPDVLPGERRPAGHQRQIQVNDRQLFAWDRSTVYAWLDATAERARSEIDDPGFLALADQAEEVTDAEGRKAYRAMLQIEAEMGDPNRMPSWSDPRYRYVCCRYARENRVGFAYIVGNVLWETGALDDPDLIIDLFRLDADKDFNPAAVNMPGFVSARRLNFLEIRTPPLEMEGYLRYFFRLGAPDGYYHLSTQLLAFYMNAFPRRDDAGYVAAAMRRVKTYFPHDYRTWTDELDNSRGSYDLDDTRVDFEGIMHATAEQARQGTLQ